MTVHNLAARLDANRATITGSWCDCGEKLIPVGALSLWLDDRLHAPYACLSDYFIAPDGEGEPSVWRRNLDRPDFPEQLVRQCEVTDAVWGLLSTHPRIDFLAGGGSE